MFSHLPRTFITFYNNLLDHNISSWSYLIWFVVIRNHNMKSFFVIYCHLFSFLSLLITCIFFIWNFITSCLFQKSAPKFPILHHPSCIWYFWLNTHSFMQGLPSRSLRNWPSSPTLARTYTHKQYTHRHALFFKFLLTYFRTHEEGHALRYYREGDRRNKKGIQ